MDGMCYILCDGSVGVLAGVNGDDLDVDLHEVVRKGAIPEAPPSCSLGRPAREAPGWVPGKTDWPHCLS